MKPNEVRIGNLVEYDNRIFEIDTIAKEFPTLNTIEFGIGVVDWNNIKPIPLTEEWLLKAGFISNPYSDRYELGDFHIEHNAERGYSIFWHDKSGATVEYFHQLQNLFFSLCGKELENL